MSDGYAFIEDEHHVQAVVVIDEPLTKVDIVRRGWASYPARILDDPSTEGFEGPVFISTAEAEKSVASGNAFKIGKWFYVLQHRGSEYHSSKYDRAYWQENGPGDSFVLDLIMTALNAPTVDLPRVPYRFRWSTEGGEKFDVTVWSYKRRNGQHDPQLDYNYLFEYSLLPGIGYKYEPDRGALISSPDNDGGVPDDVNSTKEDGVFSPSIIVNFPNCELGKNTCVSFRLDLKTKTELLATPNAGVRKAGKYTSCGLTFDMFLFPEKIRRLPMPRFSPRTATDNISCHIMNRGEVMNFIKTLYTKDIYDKIKNVLYGDGAGNILSLKWFYGIRPALSTPQKRKITLGNVVLSVTTPVFAGDFTQVYMGNVYVGGKFGDYRDYTNMRVQAYVPMVGIVDLDPSMVVGKTLHLLYTINLTDGSAVVTLSTSAPGGTLQKTEGWYETENIIFTTSIAYGYEVPLNVESIRSPSLMVGEIVAKSAVAGAVGAIAGNIPGAVLGALGGAVSSLNGVQSTYSSGSLSPNSNVMGDFTPKLIRSYNEDVSGNISPAVGRPCGKTVKVGDATGYLKAAMVYGTTTSTMQHSDEIVNMLKEGIYIS